VKLAFALTHYNDNPEATLAELQRYYPDAEVLVFDDAKEHLKTADKAGRWTERYLKAFLATDADVLIKVDPDTAVNGTVASFPEADVFGQRYMGQHVQGGAMGYSRAAAQKIVDSGLLLRAKYTLLEYTYAHKSGRSVSCQDRIVGDVVKQLGLSIAPWPAASVLTFPPKRDTGEFAFVHPRPAEAANAAPSRK
jgi:hypothetical protein